MKLLVFPNYGKEMTQDCTEQVGSILKQCGCELVMQPLCMDRFDLYSGEDKFCACDLISDCDAVIAIGGDGTIMHAAKYAAEAGKPILGVNTGRLGFLAGIEASESELLREFAAGNYSIESRMLLDVETVRSGSVVSFDHALNDAVVSRGALSKIITLRISNNGQTAMEFRADGIIVSTPTGSTAYALSAGGPVIDPSFKCIEVTPVCPHSLMDRATIFDSESELIIEADRRYDDYITLPDDSITLAVDGESKGEMIPGDKIRIRRSEICANFIKLKKQSFANLLKQKFTN